MGLSRNIGKSIEANIADHIHGSLILQLTRPENFNMYLTSWLNRFRNRLSNQSRRPVRRQMGGDRLEDRTLLTTVGILINSTELTIFADDGDDVTVQRNVTTGNVEILDAAMQTVAAVPAIHDGSECFRR
jgi:hypothetical protein